MLEAPPDFRHYMDAMDNTPQGTPLHGDHEQSTNREANLHPQTKAQQDELLATTGAIPLSVSEIIDTSTRVTEFPEDRPPMTDQQAIEALPLDHLAPDIRERVRDVFRKHVTVLAKDDYDIPPSDFIEADIHLNEAVGGSSHNKTNQQGIV